MAARQVGGSGRRAAAGAGTRGWKAAALALARAIPRERLHPAVVAFAQAAPPRVSWGVGFSGGGDSLALLLLVWAHWPERRRGLRALHFDHRLRGAASQADAQFCARVCRALGVSLVRASWRRAPGAGGVSEAQARAARLEFFTPRARILWLGHQQDDIAESMLMRLARGSGAGGLSAPRPVQRFAGGRVHLRPLLALGKKEIAAALAGVGRKWREDATNREPVFLRNRIRATVVPAWIRAAQRDAVAGAARSRALLEEDDAALESWVTELRVVDRRGRLSIGALAGKPRAVVRRALHRWMAAQRRKIDVSRQAFEALLAAAESGRPTRHSLGSNAFGVIENGWLRLAANGTPRRKFQRSAN